MRWLERRLASGAGRRGVTLIELVVAITILLILTSAVLPIARTRIKRERDRKSTRLNSSHIQKSRMPSSA